MDTKKIDIWEMYFELLNVHKSPVYSQGTFCKSYKYLPYFAVL